MTLRKKGKIASWNDDKGYGFIAPLADGKQVFVHATAFSNRGRRPQLGEIVTYLPSTDKQGRPCAIDATLAGDKLVKKAPKRPSAIALLFAVMFMAAIGMSVALGRLPEEVLIGYAALSLATFAAYALDKLAARSEGLENA